jgi:N-dimethylarginine dimethylaminohydrolase
MSVGLANAARFRDRRGSGYRGRMLNVVDETAPLTDLCVCRGDSVPRYVDFAPDHPEFEAFTMLPWDRDRLLAQQETFYALMDRLGVRVHFLPPSPDHPWQMYTRDTAFVIGDRMYYAAERGLPERRGEIDLVRRALPGLADDMMVEITAGRIEGGDVMPDGDRVYVGTSTTRTTPEAVRDLATLLEPAVEVVPLVLGPGVMHLDTRMTILPNRHLLICPTPFTPEDRAMLAERFTIIEVSDAEAVAMATNVFVPNPETVIVHAGFDRIAKEIAATGVRVERLDWSEPNALLGSFRCATMPLRRA